MFKYVVSCCVNLYSVFDEKDTMCIGLALSSTNTVGDIDTLIESRLREFDLEPSEYCVDSIHF